jgi:hypothetical protein
MYRLAANCCRNVAIPEQLHEGKSQSPFSLHEEGQPEESKAKPNELSVVPGVCADYLER